MTDAPHQADAWFNPAIRVPRKDQEVRVLLYGGADHAATFGVDHTVDWPSGASWALENGRHTLPFEAVRAWSPNPYARPGGTGPEASRDPTTPPEAEAARAASSDAVAVQPAILGETLDELEQTRALLLRLPSDGLDWSPHPDIPTLRVLACRIVRIAARIRWVLELDGVERSFEPDVPDLRSVQEIGATFAADADGVAAIAATLTAASLRAPWTLEWDGAVVASQPRGQALRAYGLRPLAYHRGELALLLTALSVRVPHPYPHWPFRDLADQPSWAAFERPDGGP